MVLNPFRWWGGNGAPQLDAPKEGIHFFFFGLVLPRARSYFSAIMPCEPGLIHKIIPPLIRNPSSSVFRPMIASSTDAKNGPIE